MLDIKYADYHMHTHYSDGVFSPTEIVKMAKKAGMRTIAITDHDGVGGVAEARIAGDALDINVISGIELSAFNSLGRKIHILGYNIDVDNKNLLNACEEIGEYRKRRNEKLIQLLQMGGYDIELAELYNKPHSGFVGKPDIARLLIEKGYVKTVEEGFDIIFERDEIKCIEKKKISSERAIKLILDAGGIPVLAHPGEVEGIGRQGGDEFFDKVEGLILALKNEGLKGLECFHPSHSRSEALKFVDMAEKYHLHITGGSDYHGDEGEYNGIF